MVRKEISLLFSKSGQKRLQVKDERTTYTNRNLIRIANSLFTEGVCRKRNC